MIKTIHYEPEEKSDTLILPYPFTIKRIADLDYDFLKKVYKLLILKSFLTVLFCFISVNIPSFSHFQRSSYVIGMFFAIMPIILTVFILNRREKALNPPNNLILQILFTISETYVFSLLCSFMPDLMINIVLMFLETVIILGANIFIEKKEISLINIPFILLAFITTAIYYYVLVMNSLLVFVTSCIVSFFFAFNVFYNSNLILSGYDNDLETEDYLIGEIVFYLDSLILMKRIFEVLSKQLIENNK